MTAVVLLGAPGSGKGTVSLHLAEVLSFQPFSTGRRIREEMDDPASNFGRLARPYMDAGDFIPDQLALELVERTLDSHSPLARFVFDGFPRTAAQAMAFDHLLDVKGGSVLAALSLEASHDVLMERLAGRWNCSRCGSTYHREHRPPNRPSICNACGAPLVARADDQGELADRRLSLYPERARGLVDLYRKDGRLVEINANRPIVEVLRDAEKMVRDKIS